jgi:formylglycine-generating enzyme required for sulfatase activity
VSLARDEKLKRPVALKEIRPDKRDNAYLRQRFLVEAEITAQLEHPGIIPIYDLDQDADGQVRYAMRFVQGRTLNDAIRDYHRQPAPLGFRELLQRFVSVCQTVAYAHSQRVIHRDLKPVNIILGDYGETLVVDWGLGKRLTASAPGPALPEESSAQGVTRPEDTTAYLPAAMDGEPLTHAGQVLGTPAYMAPEQAAGDIEGTSTSADIHGLGAILYELLTGRPPFEGQNAAEVLAAVRRGRFPRPTEIQRRVPRALEAVCLKALAREIPDRYATADDLARDVEHWLADEPVEAYHEPVTARLGRWLRWHQTLTTGVGALLLTGVIALTISTLLVSDALQKEQQARKERASAQVDALLTADPRAAPALLAGLEASQEDALPRLRELWIEEDRPTTRTRRGRVGLALLKVEPALVKDWLYAWMLEADDAWEVLLLRDELRPFQTQLHQNLWQHVENPATRPEVRFRALVALAAFDRDSERWAKWGEAVLQPLLTANPLHGGAWIEGLRPVRRVLLAPLNEVFRGRKLAEQSLAAATPLAEYAADQPALLAELTLDASPQQYPVLLPALKGQAARVRPRLHTELTRIVPEKATEAEKDRLALRQAKAAVTLLHLGEPAALWPLLRHAPDPSRRTYLTHQLRPYGVEAFLVLDRLQAETEVSARRALLLTLGEYPAEVVPAARCQELVARLVRDYRDDPDPGVHGAIEWLMRQWHEEGRLPPFRNHRPKGAAPGKPTWYVNGQGQTFAMIPGPVEFLMGSPESEPGRQPEEKAHRRKIPRAFALGTKEVTVAEFLRYLKANPHVEKEFSASGKADWFLRKYSPQEDGPIILVDWYMAGAYCNWLSKEEGLPESEWCYPKDLARFRQEVALKGKLREGRMMEEGYLRRKGYRLPTEAEWEYACRAGAVTSRYYGSSEALLGKYAWSQRNSGDQARPTGRLRPNDLGLFDVLGNVAEWCQERAGSYPEGRGDLRVEDAEDADPGDAMIRNARGGQYDLPETTARSAQRLSGRAADRPRAIGFRLARTCD